MSSQIRMAIVIVVSVVFPLFAGGWELKWSDEFDSTALNDHKWAVVQQPQYMNLETAYFRLGHDTGTTNIFVRHGNCIIEIRKEPIGITSGRLTTKGLRSFKYGRIETRMRLPKGKGFWPGMLLLGMSGGWPVCGEIDIVDAHVSVPNTIYGGFYYSKSVAPLRKSVTIDSAHNLHDDFHTYAVERSTDSIRWYFDSINYQTLDKSHYPGAPVDSPYYCQMDVNIPYHTSEYPEQTAYPESLIVDYVREYHWNPATAVAGPKMNRRSAGGFPCSVNCKGGVITLSLPASDEYTISLFEPNGRRISSVKGIGRVFRIEPGPKRTGMYLLQVVSAAASFTARVAVTR
jgi:beta-glucanase (GH16 family)